MSSLGSRDRPCLPGLILGFALACSPSQAQESPYLYGIHDHSPDPQEYLNHFAGGGVTGWVTATVAIGHNPGDTGGDDFRWLSNQGHTVICRLNNGYGEAGTIPVPGEYGNFATRCANYVAASQGCNHYIIGNETNLPNEWPNEQPISPESYADCFELCYNAIKNVDPNAQVLCQPLAPFCGPISGNDYSWTGYMYEMLTQIAARCDGPDAIAVHITSRGYTYADVHSEAMVNDQYWSFYVYKDWVNLGTPASMRTLPYYATECNGYYPWKGGHEECPDIGDPRCSYQEDWIEWIYEEINSWNQAQMSSGEGIYRCVNMYRWCSYCDRWNIDEDQYHPNPKKGQILADLDDAVTHAYRWDTTPPAPVADFVAVPRGGSAPLTVSFTDQSTGEIDTWSWSFGDEGTSGDPNPSHEYLDPDTYTVSLTVTGPGGSDTETKANYITVTEPAYDGDFDHDDDVDQEDFGFFQVCLSGSGIAQPDPACEPAQLDDDNDVDQDDFAVFLACFSGANVAPPPECLN